MPTDLPTKHQNSSVINADSGQRWRLGRLYALLIVAALPAVFDHGAISLAVSQRPTPDTPNAYLQFDHLFTLYFRVPLVILSAFVLVLSPGLPIALLLRVARTLSQWIVYGFFLALLVLAFLVTLVQATMVWTPRGFGFAMLVIACTSITFVITLVASERGRKLAFPRVTPESSFNLAIILLLPVLLLITLAPKFFWESFNGDGAHAYEASRLLLHQSLPFWDLASGEVADFPSFKSMLFTYPSSWFIRLFGEHEASARIPFALYVGVLYAGIISLVQHKPRPSLGRTASLLISSSLLSYALVMAFSATYDPYCSDIALPATQDTLLMICVLGLIHAFATGRAGWMVVITLLIFLSSPAAILIVGLFLGSVILVYRPRPWKSALIVALTVLGFVAVTALLPSLFELSGLPQPGREHSTLSLLGKFRYILPFDFKRLAYLIVPCGIYPLFGLLAWRQCDELARTLIVVTVCVFALYYFMAFISLHYFVPVMILPIVFFWYHHRPSQWNRRSAALTACCLAVAGSVALGLPESTTIYTGSRTIGHQIDVSRVLGYAHMAPQAFKASELLNHLFPFDMNLAVPATSYGGSPLAWNYYAHKPAANGSVKNYVLCPVDAAPPPGSFLVHSDTSGSIHVREPGLWNMHQSMHPPGSNGQDIYMISRDILFRRPEAFKQYWALDLLPLVQKLGFDIPLPSQHDRTVNEH